MPTTRYILTWFVFGLTLAACSPRRLPAPPPAGTTASHAAAPAATAARQPLGVGDAAPDFELINAAGTPVRLADELARGDPLVLIFYPSGQCRLCLEVLADLELYHNAFADQGVAVLAVGIQTPDQAADMVTQTGVHFPMLADSDGAVTRAYGVARLLPGKTKYGQSSFIAVVVDRSGVVAWTGSVMSADGPATGDILNQLPGLPL